MMQSKVRLSLDQIRIATPCTASWDAMEGNDRVRYCTMCRQDVFNLSALTLEEAEELIWRTEGKICARLYRRADGTILTADCHGGRRPAWRLSAWLAGTGALLAAVVSLFFRTQPSPAGNSGGQPPVAAPPTTAPSDGPNLEDMHTLGAMGYIGSDQTPDTAPLPPSSQDHASDS